jgi:AraC family transcriptional regulator
MKSELRAEYTARINRVVDFIENNLDQALTLEVLAREAHFSPFHFHRIFHAMVGESLNKFIQRLRIEKAATQLIQQPQKAITTIALDSGFASSATFARAFKEAFGMSASTWRAGGYHSYSKMGKVGRNLSKPERNRRKAYRLSSTYLAGVFNHQNWKIMLQANQVAEVSIQERPDTTVAYVRHVGPYQGKSELFGMLFEKIMKWAGPRGLLRFPETQMLSVYHDNPDITDDEKLRLSVGITVPADTEVSGEVGKLVLPGGTYAIARCEVSPEEYEQAWDAVYSSWLPESGYQPADSPCFELYHNDPETHPEKKQIVDIGIPVKPL